MDLTKRPLITDDDLRAAGIGSTIHIDGDARLSPLAADTVKERHIRIARNPVAAKAAAPGPRRIAIGADHGGYSAKEELKKLLAGMDCEVQDFGTHSTDAVDYPDFAQRVAVAVAHGRCDVGIVLDGAGIGSCMAANKVPGIRAAMCVDEATARNSREHNGANVLTLGAKMLTLERIREIVRVWLSCDLSEERHRRRVAKITEIERKPFG